MASMFIYSGDRNMNQSVSFCVLVRVDVL